jgi:hypothetical protein
MTGARMDVFAFWSRRAALAIAAIELWRAIGPAAAQTTSSRIDEALQNIAALVRSGRVGYATFWDGNKCLQRSLPEIADRGQTIGQG